MSGLCGWMSSTPPAPAAPVAIERMAAPICRFERTPLKSAANGLGAAALAGSIDCTSLLHEDGLIVALWGNPGQQASLLAQRWRSHGPWACAALSGQFAFAILDERSGEGMLAVDRFATRPLYYQACGASLVFASSQDALLRHPLAGRDVSAQALYQYLVLGAMPGSAWEAQQQLGPGECLHLRAGRVVRHTWWRMRFHEHAKDDTPAPSVGLAAALRAVLAEAGGDQQTGVMQSGGPSSAALAAMLQHRDGAGCATVPTFSVGYADGPDPARHAGGRHGHHYQQLRAADVVDAIPKLAALADRPCADSSAVAHYYCALLARGQGTLRLFSGAGLSELFGAGHYATRVARQARFRMLPPVMQQLLVEPLVGLWQGAARCEPGGGDVPAHVVHAGVFAPGALAHTLAPGFLAQLAHDRDGPLELLRQWWWGAQCRSATNRTIALDLRLGLAPRLAASQRGCFLAGVYVAFPFLDEAVSDCAAQTDPAHKHPGRWSARARALRALAPGRLAGKAVPAAMPMAAWLQSDTDLRALAFDSLSDLRRRELVAGALVDRLLTAPSPGDAQLIWQLMMLEQWFVHRAPHRLALAGRAPATAALQPCLAADPHPLGLAG